MVDRRLLSLSLVASSVGGCWSEDALIHDAFTAEQWAHLQQQFTRPEIADACPYDQGDLADDKCDLAAQFGQQLFFEPALSGPETDGGKTSCATCHDAEKWFIDSRADNALSMGAVKKTPHNTISLVNVAQKRGLLTWSGMCTNPFSKQTQPCDSTMDVVRDIALPKAMASTPAIVARTIRSKPAYAAAFHAIWDEQPNLLNDDNVQTKVELALDAYMRRLNSFDAPFDAFIAGDNAAISDNAKRGFALFVARAMCLECHSGYFFTDDQPRNTGVPDATLDPGAGDGQFWTGSLRHIAQTAPYMHNGATMKTLGDVIWHYREAHSFSTTYAGTKHYLMSEKLDISDDEAKHLEEFLHTLTGKPVPDELRKDTRGEPITTPMPATCTVENQNQGLICNGVCTNVTTDRNNCGACGKVCDGMEVCMGQCYPLNCMPPTMACNGMCIMGPCQP